MKILIGVMYCIENEFERCIQSIESQTYTNFEHFVISKLPNKQAHEKLYDTFQKRSSEFDLFIKIDADMVLASDNFFKHLVEYAQSTQFSRLVVYIRDCFTEKLINGLHVFTQSTKWIENNESYFVDHIAEKNGRVLIKDGKLVPAAYHCPDPSDFQAFHFGLHKAVKVLQIGSKNKNSKKAKTHQNNILELINVYKTEFTRKNAFAIIGALTAIRYKLDYTFVNFDNTETLDYFNLFGICTDFQLKEMLDLLLSNQDISRTFSPNPLQRRFSGINSMYNRILRIA